MLVCGLRSVDVDELVEVQEREAEVGEGLCRKEYLRECRFGGRGGAGERAAVGEVDLAGE